MVTLWKLGGGDISDSLFYRISRKVVFPVNKYDIPKDSPLRRELLGEILPYFNSNDYVLEAIVLRGAASPEGPYEWNRTLSRLRSKSLLNLISSSVSQPLDSVLSVKEMPEDYLYLLLLMKERGDEDYQRVAAVVDKYIDTDPKRLKSELMSDKTLWKRLLRDYFPEMRTARAVLFFKKRDGIDLQPIAPLDYITNQVGSPNGVPAIMSPVNPLLPAYIFDMRTPHRELLSVKTNLLFDLAYMPGYNRFCPIPNIAVEYYPLRGHFTLGASLDFPWWQHYDKQKYFQIRNYQLEARYYLKDGSVDRIGCGNGAAYTGWYFQAYVNAALYGICFDKKRGWEGEGAGGGLGVGYVLPLTRKGHWRLEFGLQAGVFFTKYDPYQYESVLYPDRHDGLYYYKWNKFGNLFKRRQHQFTWFGPTRVGVTLTYDLLYRFCHKRGISLKSWEVQR